MERLEVPHYMYEITVSKLDYAESRLQHKAAQIEKSKIAAYRELARMRADYFYELREMLEAYIAEQEANMNQYLAAHKYYRAYCAEGRLLGAKEVQKYNFG